ncbi:MAG: Gfo/Idh/MocA family oxidoreductase [Chloroflexi bacterium]|nr:Gfo/Idh/MocA family oxidoreductase [Chloroflexota bacterium]
MTLRVGVIGLGLMGRHHTRVLHDLEHVTLAAVADPDPLARARATRGRDLHAYEDYRQMLDQEHLDLTIVAVPTSLHREVATTAMRAGAHVLIEKPIAATGAEALEIIAVAQECGRRIAVGHIERFNPAVVALKQRLARGELGKVFRLHARRMGPFPARIRDVGVVIDLATHDIDISRYLMASEPTRIYAETARRIHTDHEDMLSALLRFGNDALVQLDVNWLTPTKIREVNVTGERGMFTVNYLTQELTLFENNLPEDGAVDNAVISVVEGKMVRFRVEPKEPLRAELEDVISAIIEGRAPLVGPRDAYQALMIAEAIVSAGRTGDVVTMLPHEVLAFA